MDSLGSRMRKYEAPFDMVLPPRMPIIIRLDGMAFHTLTKSMNRPFDEAFTAHMARTTRHLCETIPTAALGFTQSDEISVLLVYYQRLESEPWFGNRTNKIISFTISQAASFFNQPAFRTRDNFASFDAKIFVLPREDVENYFIWRWKDWIRNSLSMLARTHFSHKELLNKKREDMHEMLYSKGVNWADCDDTIKNGIILRKEHAEDRFYWHLEAAPKDINDWRELIKPLVNPEV